MLFRLILTLCLLVQPMLGWWCQMGAVRGAAVGSTSQTACCCGDAEAVCPLWPSLIGQQGQSGATGLSGSGGPVMPRPVDGTTPRSCCMDVPRLPSTDVRLVARAERVDPVAGFFGSASRWSRSAVLSAELGPQGREHAGVKNRRAALCVWVI